MPVIGVKMLFFWCDVNEKTADLLKNPPFSIKILLFVFL
jgi:hypothetical protein